MAFNDYETVMYTAIRQALESDPDWSKAVSPGNRVWYDDAQGIEVPNVSDTMLQAEGDYPQSELWLKSGGNRMFLEAQTFATWSDAGPAHWVERPNLVFRLELTSALLNVGEPNLLRTLSEKALRKAGSRLKQSICIGSQYTFNQDRRRTHETASQWRWKTQIDITVFLEFDGSIYQ